MARHLPARIAVGDERDFLAVGGPGRAFVFELAGRHLDWFGVLVERIDGEDVGELALEKPLAVELVAGRDDDLDVVLRIMPLGVDAAGEDEAAAIRRPGRARRAVLEVGDLASLAAARGQEPDLGRFGLAFRGEGEPLAVR